MNGIGALVIVVFSLVVAHSSYASIAAATVRNIEVFEEINTARNDLRSVGVPLGPVFASDDSHGYHPEQTYPDQDFNSFQLVDLISGSYKSEHSGTRRGLQRSNLGGFSVDSVRETDTWIMLVVGAGLISYQLRRVQRKLEGAVLPLSVKGS